MLLRALRFILAATIAAVLWSFAAPAYNAALAFCAEPLLRIDPRLRSVDVHAVESRILARGDVHKPDLPLVIIPANELTYNLVLFAGLFCSERKPLRDGGWRRLALALGVLVLTHVLAIAVSIEATYATRLGEWSEKNYSSAQQDFWSATEYAYRLAGMFGIAFACWWVSGPAAVRTDPAPPAV